jgi:hypothetical protein
MADVLIVYSIVQWPPVATLSDSLYAFERYSQARCWYLNIGLRGVPRWLRRIRFDAVLFHPTFLWDRVNPPRFERHRRELRRLDGVGRCRVALPQDEFLQSDALEAFSREFDIDHIFSVAPESEWGKLYGGLDRDRVGLSRVLTGYLAPDRLERIDAALAESESRPLAIGYRSARVSPALGRHGALKEQIAARVREASERRRLPVDIAVGAAASIRGDAWYRFLAACRYTIGVEGGSSVHDRDGALAACTARYVAEHPDARFEEIEEACFPGEDGGIAYAAISPRHLEACATRTAQILIEGAYNGILRPGEHYIELKRDFSNLEAVLDLVERDSERARIVENAYRDVVASGLYTYERLVRDVETVALAASPVGAPSPRAQRALYRWARAVDRASWMKAALYRRVTSPLTKILLAVLPARALGFIRTRLAGTELGAVSALHVPE